MSKLYPIPMVGIPMVSLYTQLRLPSWFAMRLRASQLLSWVDAVRVVNWPVVP